MKVICPHCRNYTPLRADGFFRVHRFYRFDGDYQSGEWVICPLSGTNYAMHTSTAATVEKAID